jgi:hypothetical protein
MERYQFCKCYSFGRLSNNTGGGIYTNVLPSQVTGIAVIRAG